MAGTPNHIQIANDSTANYDVPSESDSRFGYADGKALPQPEEVGHDADTGFYRQRDTKMGYTPSRWTAQPESAARPSGSNFYSAGDTAEVFNSGSGLGGERTTFTDTLSQADLAGGVNADSPFGH